MHTDDAKVFDLSRTNTGAKLLVFKTSSYVIIEETIIVVWLYPNSLYSFLLWKINLKVTRVTLFKYKVTAKSARFFWLVEVLSAL